MLLPAFWLLVSSVLMCLCIFLKQWIPTKNKCKGGGGVRRSLELVASPTWWFNEKSEIVTTLWCALCAIIATSDLNTSNRRKNLAGQKWFTNETNMELSRSAQGNSESNRNKVGNIVPQVFNLLNFGAIESTPLKPIIPIIMSPPPTSPS